MANEAMDVYRDVVRRCLRGEEVSRSELGELQFALNKLVDDSTATGHAPQDPPSEIWLAALDILTKLSLLEPEEATYYNSAGLLLAEMGRHSEAATAFLLASERLQRDIEAGRQTLDDDPLWADAWRVNSCRHFLLARYPLSAAQVLKTINDASYLQEAKALFSTGAAAYES